MLELNDFDAAYEASRQARLGNQIMGYPPQVQIANKILEFLDCVEHLHSICSM
jgi:hypothetical protein